MDLSKLKATFKDEPRYRFKQAYQAVFGDLIEDWSQASNLPQALRERLHKDCPLGISALSALAADGTEKALLTLADGLRVEAVLIRQEDSRCTVCVSSQVGCPMGCLFCATGRIGFKRNLSREEIVDQAVYFARRLSQEGQKVTNVVFMGMGEPFLNYDNVLGAIRFLNDPGTLGLGARRFSISTAGVTHGIKKLAEEKLEINLALSLHAPEPALRSRIMPINDKYPLDKVMKEIKLYTDKTRRRVMFEYLMIDGLNDSPKEARALAELVNGHLGFVNLIAYNATRLSGGQAGGLKSSPPPRIREFKEILEKARIAVTVRHRFGEGIDAACGQLAGKSKPRQRAGGQSAARSSNRK